MWIYQVVTRIIYHMQQLHLRRVGVEARPELVRGIPKDGDGGTSSEQDDRNRDHDDAPKDDKTEGNGDADDTTKDDKSDSGGSSTEGGPPLLPESTDDQVHSTTKSFHAIYEIPTPVLLHGSTESNVLASKTFIDLMCHNFILNMLPLYLGHHCTLSGSHAGNLKTASST